MELPYNPCKDGFEAKVWECLRRNDSFRGYWEFIENIPDGEDKDLAQAATMEEMQENGNDYAESVINAMGAREQWDMGKIWPEQPESCRNSFKNILKLGRPSIVEKPRLDEAIARLGNWFNEETRNLVIEVLFETKGLWSQHDLIRIPRFIRDTEHRKTILTDIDKLIPKSPRKARWLKPNGRMLGEKAYWDAFLIHEWWTRLHFNFEDAADLTARERYAKEDLRHFDAEYSILNARKELKLKDKHKHSSTVEKQVRAIGNHIKAVFPRFAPFL